MSELEEEGIPPLEDQPPGIDGANEVEGLIPPGDEPKAADDWGTTEREQQLDEPLADRVRRDEPERARAADAPVGRLVQPDAGMIGADDEPTEVAMESEDDDALAAEEAAIHLTDSP
jgi:hypothetical protein